MKTEHSFVSTNHASLGDLRKPFDISLKGSFQLINAVIPLEKKHYVCAITGMWEKWREII